MSSVVHTWQSWRHVLQPRTPWHQPPVKHLIVPCVAQEHNHTCSSGSSKHAKPTSSPLHVLGFQQCKSLSQYRWKTSNYSNRHNFHEIRSIQETSCHPLFFHFTILIKDMCIGFTRKKIIPQNPHVFLIPLAPPGIRERPPAPRFMAPRVATSVCWIRLQGTQGMEGVQGTKNHRNFLGKSVSKIISSIFVWYPKNIYVAPTNLCVFSWLCFFLGGGWALPKTNIAPLFRLGFWFRRHLNSLHLTLHHIQRPCDKPTWAVGRCRIHLLPGDD